MALIHSYFVDIFVHGKLLHSSASRTHVTIYDVKKCQQNTHESMPKCNVFIGTEKNSELHLKNYIFWKDRATHSGVLIAVKKNLSAVEILSSTILRVYTVSA